MTNTGSGKTARKKNEWPLKELQGLTMIVSPLLMTIPHLTHAFTTRLGGQSQPPLESFNLGRHWSTEESRHDAMVNRARLCDTLAIDPGSLLVPGQVHSSVVAWATENLSCVDGVAASDPGTAILLHYADCVPIIIFEKTLPAVSVVHAGWRGTAGGIAQRAVQLLSDRLKVVAKNMVAAIGPAIGSCCYCVGDDVGSALSASVSGCQDFINRRDGALYADLQSINAWQLHASGVREIDICSACTSCQYELFYSHRASGGRTGRQGAIASLHAS